MLNQNAYKKTLMTFALVIMVLSWIVNYPITTIASDGCKNCAEICQCAKTEILHESEHDAENPSCDNLSSCLDKTSPEIPFNVSHTNNLVENQAKYDGVIPTNIFIHHQILASYIEYEFYSPKRPLYVTNSQYRSPPSL